MSKCVPSVPKSRASTKKPVRVLIANRRSAWPGVTLKALGVTKGALGTACTAASCAGSVTSGGGGLSAGICACHPGSLLKLGVHMHLMWVGDGDPFAVEGQLDGLVYIRADLYEV